MTRSASLQAPLSILLVVSAALNAALWALAIWFARGQQAAAVLHYSTAVGIDFIGEGKQIITLPVIGLSVLIGNTVLGFFLRHNDPRTAWILWSIIPLAQVITLSAFALIWQANR